MDEFDVTLQGLTEWLMKHGLADLDFKRVRQVRFTLMGVEVDQYEVGVGGGLVQDATGTGVKIHTTARRYSA